MTRGQTMSLIESLWPSLSTALFFFGVLMLSLTVVALAFLEDY